MSPCDKQKLKRLTRIGTTPIHRASAIKDDAHLMGFCQVRQIRYDQLVQTVVLREQLWRYSLSNVEVLSSLQEDLLQASAST